MPWFESSKEKQLRELLEAKMEICLTKPDKYDQAFMVLESYVRKPNQKAIETMVNHIKQVIKEDEFEPAQKLRAIILLRDLMASQSKPLGKYVVTKILKRLTILAEHRKNEKDLNRGANIFKCKKSEEKYGIQFLKVLLLCLSDWGKNWPRHADGPFHDFQSAYNDLLMQKQVTFPPDEKKISKSPVPKVNRNSKQQLSSPPKMPTGTANEKMIANRLSKPVIKQKEPVTGKLAEYFNSMIEISNLLSSTLSENPEFGEIWGIIRAYVDQFKSVDEQGNLIVAQMVEAGEQNEQILQAIQTNSQFIAELIKDTRTVDNKNQNYGKYNGKYVKRCKKLVLSLSIYVEKPNSSLTNNNNASGNLKPPAQTSMNEKVEEAPMPEKPKAELERNRYGSSNQLRKNLQINLHPVKKEDFNSGTLNKHHQNSQGSSRYNSVTGNQNEKNRFSASSQFNEIKEKEKEATQTKKQSEDEKVKPEEKILDFFVAASQNKETKKQISKISEQNENQSTINKFDYDNDVPKNQKDNEKVNQIFGQFQVSGEKRQSSNSNSQFFNQLENDKAKMPAGKPRDRRDKKIQNKNVDQLNDFFNISVKSKIGENISGFSKQKQISQEAKQNQNSHQNSQLKAFDTFKSPNQIGQAMNQLKKSGEEDSRSQRSEVSNPFGKPNTQNQNPFGLEFGENSFHRSNRSERSFDNPFAVRTEKAENPFEQKNEDNPFATKIQRLSEREKKQEDEQNKSRSSNPFSAKHNPSEKSQQRSSIKSKPPIPRKKSDINPFDTKSYHSRKNDENEPEKPNFNNSMISNPFENAQKKQMSQSKSLSQRGSFINVKVGSMKNPSNIIDNPFDAEETQKTPVEDKKDKSFQGFNFDDFMNVSGQKSQSKSMKNKQSKPEKQLNESGFQFSDFGEVRNSQHEKSSSFTAKNFFEQTSKLTEKQNSFNLFPKAENENKPQAENFFETSKQFKNSKENNINFFETSKDQKNNSKANQNMNKPQAREFGFDDFPNLSHSNSNQAKNPFSEFQQSKSSAEPIQIEQAQKPIINTLEDSWSKIGKKSSHEQSDEWKKFANIADKKSQQSKSNRSEKQSQYEPSEPEKKQDEGKQLPWQIGQSENQDNIRGNTNRRFDEYDNNEPKFGNSEKSISIHFDEPSPFQKKQIPWQFTHAALPSSTRYNIGPESLKQKRQVLIQVQAENKYKIEKYNQVNEQLNKLRKQYSIKIEKLGYAREQKNEFIKILNRLKETNEVKQREIEDLIKKKLRSEELKTKILEKERILYERMKNQRRFKDQELINKERIGNKWERFNQNLKKHREITQLQKTASHFSYYA